jgi:hypothetical protein
MARAFLFGWPGAGDCDQGYCAASFFGRRARAGSTQVRASICALNESAKSDRLELPKARAEPEIIVPAAKAMPAETPSTNPGTVKKVADQHWRNANAKINPVASLPRRPKSKELIQSPGKNPGNERTAAWHCRQDAIGSLLRSLDLSPRCNLKRLLLLVISNAPFPS